MTRPGQDATTHNFGGIMRRLTAACMAALIGTVGLPGTAHSFVGTLQTRVVEPMCNGKVATIVGTEAGDELVGSDADDVIVGLGGDDRIYGGLGNDTLCGDEGADLLRGNSGDDELLGGLDANYDYETVGDELNGGPGNDHLDGGLDTRQVHRTPDALSFTGAPGGVTVDVAAGTATGYGNDTVVTQPLRLQGTPYSDVLMGSDGSDSLVGGEGADHLVGRGGRDWLYGDEYATVGGPADDVLEGGPGPDLIFASRGSDQLLGGPGRDRLYDEGVGSDVLKGNEGHDVVVGQLTSAVGQVIDGGPGPDSLRLYQRRSQVTFTMASSVFVFERQGAITTATVSAFSRYQAVGGLWTVVGTSGDDFIDARYAIGVRFASRGGDDRLVGSDHDDWFDGGRGSDIFTPGHGEDTCIRVETITPHSAICEVPLMGPLAPAPTRISTAVQRGTPDHAEEGL